MKTPQPHSPAANGRHPNPMPKQTPSQSAARTPLIPVPPPNQPCPDPEEVETVYLRVDVNVLVYHYSYSFDGENWQPLPVEFDASKRAKAQLVNLGIIDKDELVGVNQTLDAAAYTYVAAFISSLGWLLYFLSRR